MINHEIFAILRSFTKVEVKRLRKFISSPYFNTNSKITELFKHVIRFYPSFLSKKLSKEIFYRKLYKKEKYNDSTMRNLMFRFEQLLKFFLIIENLSQNKLQKGNILLEEINLKILRDLYTKESKKLEIEYSKSVGTDFNYYYNKYKSEVNKFNYFILTEQKTKKSQLLKQYEVLNKSNLFLTIFFITETICNYLNALTYLHKYKIFQKSDFINSLVRSIDFEKIYGLVTKEDENEFILKIYVLLLKCFTDFENDQHYFNYKTNVNKNATKLSSDEISFHYSRLINYCILKQNNSKKGDSFKNELFQVYKVFIEKSYYIDRKTQFLPHNLYRAILFLSLGLKEFSWSEKFILNYSLKVEPQHRDNMIYFGHSFYNFYIGQYQKSLDYSKRVSNDYFIFKQDMNSLSLRLNFILYNPEEIHRIIHKYKEAIREDEYLQEKTKSAHLNFIKYSYKLVQSIEGNKKVELGIVRQKLNQCENIIQKDWLLNQYDLQIKKSKVNRAS